MLGGGGAWWLDVGQGLGEITHPTRVGSFDR
jgi:hypothetical protein